MLAASLLQTSDKIVPEDSEQLEIIDISAKRMQRLIADLLDVTRLEGGKQLPIDPAPLSVQSLFDETYELFKSQAVTASITDWGSMRSSHRLVAACSVTDWP